MSRELDANIVYGFALPEEPVQGTIMPYREHLEMDYSGTEFTDQVVFYVRSSKVSASKDPVSFILPEISPEGKRQVEALARTFGVSAGWVLYPTYF